MKSTPPEDWDALTSKMHAEVYRNPNSAIEAARRLLTLSGQPEHLAMIYEKLGFAHLVLGEHRLSSLFYEQTLRFDPQNMYALANLAHAQYELGEHDKAVLLGKEALSVKDRHACQHALQFEGQLESRFAGTKNIIAFSLYGNYARYCEMAVLNVMAARRHLPEFICRFYVDTSTPPVLQNRLTALGAQCVQMNDHHSGMPATFWRFLAMDDVEADCVLVRDVDSLIDAKEAWCVQDWRQSGQAFHVIRDDCCHTELILAGLFGIRSGTLRHIASRIATYLQMSGRQGQGQGQGQARDRFADQLFLRYAVWPAVREQTLTHDRIYSYGPCVHAVKYVSDISNGPHNTFIGANYATLKLAYVFDQFTRNATPFIEVTDSVGELICRYAMQREESGGSTQNNWCAYLPMIYREAIQRGQWRCNITLQTDDALGQGEGSIDSQLLGIDAIRADASDTPGQHST